MKIAIIGSGISGLTASYLLNQQHDITLFESDSRLGGHTATIDFQLQGRDYRVDTGFIVFNDWTYPNFIKLMNQIGVSSKPTRMSFSVADLKTGLEYGGAGLNTLFAQRKNLFNFAHLGMIKDILRFNKEAIADLETGELDPAMTLGEYLDLNNYSQQFIDFYLIPMGAAIWSSTLSGMREFPLLFFVRFFKNHGLLSVKNRPQWHVIENGSNSYIEPLSAGFKNNIRLNTKITQVKRSGDAATLIFSDGEQEHFDQVVFACHSDQALKLLADPSQDETRVLGSIPYRENEVVLHTDAKLLPKSQLAWSAWNYQLGHSKQALPVLSYNMNILQGIESEHTFVVTLNATEQIDPSKIIGTYHYAHPVFTLGTIEAQEKWELINGVNRTWFCGAYWANGFHEDGCASGVRVATALGAKW